MAAEHPQWDTVGSLFPLQLSSADSLPSSTGTGHVSVPGVRYWCAGHPKTGKGTSTVSGPQALRMLPGLRG